MEVGAPNIIRNDDENVVVVEFHRYHFDSFAGDNSLKTIYCESTYWNDTKFHHKTIHTILAKLIKESYGSRIYEYS